MRINLPQDVKDLLNFYISKGIVVFLYGRCVGQLFLGGTITSWTFVSDIDPKMFERLFKEYEKLNKSTLNVQYIQANLDDVITTSASSLDSLACNSHGDIIDTLGVLSELENNKLHFTPKQYMCPRRTLRDAIDTLCIALSYELYLDDLSQKQLEAIFLKYDESLHTLTKEELKVLVSYANEKYMYLIKLLLRKAIPELEELYKFCPASFNESFMYLVKGEYFTVRMAFLLRYVGMRKYSILSYNVKNLHVEEISISIAEDILNRYNFKTSECIKIEQLMKMMSYECTSYLDYVLTIAVNTKKDSCFAEYLTEAKIVGGSLRKKYFSLPIRELLTYRNTYIENFHRLKSITFNDLQNILGITNKNLASDAYNAFRLRGLYQGFKVPKEVLLYQCKELSFLLAYIYICSDTVKTLYTLKLLVCYLFMITTHIQVKKLDTEEQIIATNLLAGNLELVIRQGVVYIRKEGQNLKIIQFCKSEDIMRVIQAVNTYL